MQNINRWRSNQFQPPSYIFWIWSNISDANLEDSDCIVRMLSFVSIRTFLHTLFHKKVSPRNNIKKRFCKFSIFLLLNSDTSKNNVWQFFCKQNLWKTRDTYFWFADFSFSFEKDWCFQFRPVQILMKIISLFRWIFFAFLDPRCPQPGSNSNLKVRIVNFQ